MDQLLNFLRNPVVRLILINLCIHSRVSPYTQAWFTPRRKKSKFFGIFRSNGQKRNQFPCCIEVLLKMFFALTTLDFLARLPAEILIDIFHQYLNLKLSTCLESAVEKKRFSSVQWNPYEPEMPESAVSLSVFYVFRYWSWFFFSCCCFFSPIKASIYGFSF